MENLPTKQEVDSIYSDAVELWRGWKVTWLLYAYRHHKADKKQVNPLINYFEKYAKRKSKDGFHYDPETLESDLETLSYLRKRTSLVCTQAECLQPVLQLAFLDLGYIELGEFKRRNSFLFLWKFALNLYAKCWQLSENSPNDSHLENWAVDDAIFDILNDRLALEQAYIWRKLERRQVAGEVGQIEIPPESQPDPKDANTVQSAALKAVVDGGLAGVLNAASKGRAVEGANAAMQAMLDKDTEYFGWRQTDWARHLGCSTKTISPTEAWARVMAWRVANKECRLNADEVSDQVSDETD